jgi:membrane-associated phospholipid phosphatase
VGLAAPRLRRRLSIPKPAVSVLAWQAPVALALALPSSRPRDAGIYTLQMLAYVAHYEMPADDAERIRRRLRVRYPITIDRLIGGGQVPTLRLQRILGRPGEVRPHDLALSWVHWVWYFVPHGSVAYVLVRHRERYGRAACLTAAVFDLGLLFYWAVPTAPPWWAGQQGHLPPVRRIMTETGESFWGGLWRPLYDSLAGNPFAAMPSLHFATSVMAAHVLSDVGRGPGRLGWAYAATLGFGLVYLGEHYVIDLIVGLALAEGVRLAAPMATPAFRTVGRAVQRLEPRTV